MSASDNGGVTLSEMMVSLKFIQAQEESGIFTHAGTPIYTLGEVAILVAKALRVPRSRTQ